MTKSYRQETATNQIICVDQKPSVASCDEIIYIEKARDILLNILSDDDEWRQAGHPYQVLRYCFILRLTSTHLVSSTACKKSNAYISSSKNATVVVA